MSKEKLIALLKEIDNELQSVESKLSIFGLVAGDEAIPQTASYIQEKIASLHNIEFEDLKDYVGSL